MGDVALATMLVNSSSMPLFRKMQHRIIMQYVPTHQHPPAS